MDHIIRTTNIVKLYVMGVEELYALKGVSMEIQRNEYVAIMGPSILPPAASMSSTGRT